MKKIIGLFSLIAILMINLPVQAEAASTDNDVGFEYIGRSYDEAAIILHFANAGIEVEFDSDGLIVIVGGQEDAEFDGGVDYSKIINAFRDLPIDYGLCFKGVNKINYSSFVYTKLNSVEPDSKNTYTVSSRYSDAESPVGWQSSKTIN